jgi:V-type H+-transporting ATPase subunit F
VADEIRYLLNDYDKLMPAVLEIPSKDHPYDPEKDSVMGRVLKLTGQQ